MVKLILDYEKIAYSTDKFKQDDIQSILLGLFGEVGSIMATIKKSKREEEAFFGYRNAVIDELGDAFWYFTALTRRYGLSVADVISDSVKNNKNANLLQVNDDPQYPVAQALERVKSTENIFQALIKLGQATTSLLNIEDADKTKHHQLFCAFAVEFFEVTSQANISFKEVLETNSKKTQDLFILPDYADLPTFDDEFPPEEQFPRYFEFKIKERENGRAYMQMNDVFIGDLLKDNIRDEDYFRFHDALHFAYVAILHWSPNIRALLKRKRKSNPDFDDNEDGGRAIVIEEGLTGWVFSKAKELDYFDGHDKVSVDILKTIKDFVRGYEVEKCPERLWQVAILEGYRVFRLVKENGGGYIIGDMDKRTLEYKPLEEEND